MLGVGGKESVNHDRTINYGFSKGYDGQARNADRRGRKKRKDRREQKGSNNPHLLQAQKALVLLSSKLVGRPGTESLPSTFAPPDHPPRQEGE